MSDSSLLTDAESKQRKIYFSKKHYIKNYTLKLH